MAEEKDRKSGFEEANLRFQRKMQASLEKLEQMPPEERKNLEKQVKDLWNRATMNGSVE